MFGCPDIKITFSFAVINSIAAITLETINNTSAEFFWDSNWLGALAGNFKKSFNLQNGNVISNKFSRHVLISNDLLPGNGKTKTNYF